jgi:hypothetical protein
MKSTATWSAIDFWMTIVSVKQVARQFLERLFVQNCGNSKNRTKQSHLICVYLRSSAVRLGFIRVHSRPFAVAIRGYYLQSFAPRNRLSPQTRPVFPQTGSGPSPTRPDGRPQPAPGQRHE